MKKYIIIGVLFIVIKPLFAQTGTVIVNVSGIVNNTGLIQIALHNTNDGKIFPKSKNPYKIIFIKSNKHGVNHKFTDVVPGEYAVTVYHDENSNKKLDRYFFGPPKENYGYSRNKYHTFGPPSFDEVKFKVNERKIITLKIRIE